MCRNYFLKYCQTIQHTRNLQNKCQHILNIEVGQYIRGDKLNKRVNLFEIRIEKRNLNFELFLSFSENMVPKKCGKILKFAKLNEILVKYLHFQRFLSWFVYDSWNSWVRIYLDTLRIKPRNSMFGTHSRINPRPRQEAGKASEESKKFILAKMKKMTARGKSQFRESRLWPRFCYKKCSIFKTLPMWSTESNLKQFKQI